MCKKGEMGMDWVTRMNAAVDCMETRLTEADAVERAARAAQCSVYNFQRMFTFITDMTPAAYLRARRLTQAALELQSGSARILDVALRWGYESPDSFSRAFRAFHGVLPSQARNAKLTLMPPLSFSISIKGGARMSYRIEHRPACTLAGYPIALPNDQAVTFERVPLYWEEIVASGRDRRLRALARPDALCPQGILGAYAFDPDGKNGRYFAAVTVWTDTPGCKASPVPADMATCDIPEADWAVVDAQGDAAQSVADVIRRYWAEWLPASNWEPLNLPQIECYLNPEATVQQICFPIRRNKE